MQDHSAPAPVLAGPVKAKTAILIVNPKSRDGEAARAAVADKLKAHGIEVLEHECRSREQVTALIREQAQRVDLVAVAGGDGTMNAAAQGLRETGLPLGILPTGTANDLARTLAIPPDLDRAAAIIAAGHTRTIDLGSVNGKPFFNVASLGLSAELSKKLTRDVKRRFGRLGYLVTALRVLARARPFTAEIIVKDETIRTSTLQIAVGNGRYYGGGNIVAQDAAIDDRKLDLYSLEFRQAWKLALLARSFRSGEHGAWDEVRAIRGDEFEVRTRRPRPINADGEIVTQTPARFTIHPCAVTVFAPEAGDPASGSLLRGIDAAAVTMSDFILG